MNQRRINIDGVERSIVEWARYYNVNPQIFYTRIHKGMEVVEAITTPIQISNRTKPKRWSLNEIRLLFSDLSNKEIAEITGRKRITIKHRRSIEKRKGSTPGAAPSQSIVGFNRR